MLPFKNIQFYGIVGVSVIAVALGIGWYVARANLNAKISEFDAFKTKIAADARLLESRRDFIDKTIVNSYESTIAQMERHYEKHPNIKRVYIERMQHNDTSCNQTSSTTETTNARPDGVEEDSAEADSRTVLDIRKASQEVVQCLELIKWAKEQAEVDVAHGRQSQE